MDSSPQGHWGEQEISLSSSHTSSPPALSTVTAPLSQVHGPHICRPLSFGKAFWVCLSLKEAPCWLSHSQPWGELRFPRGS